MLDYRIDTFLTLCEQMNYRKTADILHISQPAVTQQIHYLENQYGRKLFQYENRRLVKTEAAVILEKYARAAKLQEQGLREKLESDPLHSLRIGATKTIGDYYLKKDIRRYLQSPDNALTLLVDNTEHLLKLLEENELDFAVVEGFLKSPALTIFCFAGSLSWASAAKTTPSPGGRSPSTNCSRRRLSTGNPVPVPGRY